MMLKKMKIKPQWQETFDHLKAYAEERNISEGHFEQTFQTCILLGMKEDQIKKRLEKYRFVVK